MDKGKNVDVLVDAALLLDNHDYFLCTTSDYILSYITEYVARKGPKFTKFVENKKVIVYDDYLKTLVLKPNDVILDSQLILLKTKGSLKHPSTTLVALLSFLEQGIIEATKKGDLNATTLFSITNVIDRLSQLPLVGCKNINTRLRSKL